MNIGGEFLFTVAVVTCWIFFSRNLDQIKSRFSFFWIKTDTTSGTIFIRDCSRIGQSENCNLKCGVLLFVSFLKFAHGHKLQTHLSKILLK